MPGIDPPKYSASDRSGKRSSALQPVESAPAFVSTQVTEARRFYLNLKPRAARRLTVICGGCERCAAEYIINRRTFPFWSIEFVAAGEGELTLAGKKQALRAGTVFTYGPHVPHIIRTAAEPTLVKYFVDFIGTPSVPLLRASGLRPGTMMQVTAIGDVRNAFDSLLQLGSQQDSLTEEMCSLQLTLLIHTIARSRHAANASERRARATYERVRQFMDERFLEVASIEQVAASSHVDGSHLCRLFRRFHSESPLHYLLRRRMQWAADRLQGSAMLVREVADELRIDPFQFSRTFKRVHGVSPTAFLATRGETAPRMGMRGT